MAIYSYLKMISGNGPGKSFPLDASHDNLIGRGLECDITLTDPLCSRVHAAIFSREGKWFVQDRDSRNGSYLNDAPVQEAELKDGCRLKLGDTEFTFNHSAQPPTSHDELPLSITQTIVRNMPVNPQDTNLIALKELKDYQQAQRLLLLHQFAIRLLGEDDPNTIIQVTLEMVKEQTKAVVVGFLWLSDDGQLRAKRIYPEDTEGPAPLSEALTEIVTKKGNAVWIANETPGETSKKLTHFADAICVPLIHAKKTFGALHLYRERERFWHNELDFAISVGNILTIALLRAWRVTQLQAGYQRLVDKSAAFDELIGNSPAMGELKQKITRISKAAGCVLVRGESGSGKELVARALHKASNRADRPMLSVNCAALPENLMESQLFGHKKGAFTGADSDHIGFFQQADTGTLFLDEVGELTLDGQAKLLRILEGHPFLPLGATKEVSVDVRVIAATNRDLAEFVREKRFREDLYYRLSVFELYIPPLRERGDDIILLAEHFLEHFRKSHGRPLLTLSEGAMKKLADYAWPGNVRQLRNVIDSSVVLADGESIQAHDLGLRDAGLNGPESLRFDYWEKKLIEEALSRTGGNIPEAVKLLGTSRATLYRKIEEYQIQR
ncbi:sigma 54-interacting transcriptional regulator [Blastopirellula marina]|uniref:sigma 54-interacting transcriptional regulator n=1 Tax=Blastopirellula marina TaxID=124 RepID=UPI0018EB6953|nr:sigma 54-interacting transcriptional regulator [Blastopirellula marina]